MIFNQMQSTWNSHSVLEKRKKKKKKAEFTQQRQRTEMVETYNFNPFCFDNDEFLEARDPFNITLTIFLQHRFTDIFVQEDWVAFSCPT